MSECFLWIKRDFGEQIVLVAVAESARFAEADEADPGSIRNGGSGVPVLQEELKR